MFYISNSQCLMACHSIFQDSGSSDICLRFVTNQRVPTGNFFFVDLYIENQNNLMVVILLIKYKFYKIFIFQEYKV